VFGSLLARWNDLSPMKLSESIKAIVEGKVKLSRYNLRTHILHFPNYQEVGFEGSSVFMIDKDVDDETVQALNALADFAFYSGVGAKTTMGMGQTVRPNPNPFPAREGVGG
ncbi:MAG: CRISPR system precrRNA processing endoribonuclease RAMP protein Cas6, partial [Chloroflexota bacterium]